jgi:hypothetical protein
MTKSKLGGDKSGLGFYELMTAPEGIYLKALAVIEKNDFNKFFEILGVNKPNDLKGDANGHNKSNVRADF